VTHQKLNPRNGRRDRISTTALSEDEFERIEDRLDDMGRPQGQVRAARRRRPKRSRLIGLGVFVALFIAVVVFAGGSSTKPPSCKARTHGCRETSNGYWVPFWYYGALSLAQGTSSSGGAPSTAGTLPSSSQLEQAGATAAQADEAASYAQSADSDDSGDDSGSDDSGDDGGDGGGDGGGGGD
jgi:hypothetical protein